MPFESRVKGGLAVAARKFLRNFDLSRPYRKFRKKRRESLGQGNCPTHANGKYLTEQQYSELGRTAARGSSHRPEASAADSAQRAVVSHLHLPLRVASRRASRRAALRVALRRLRLLLDQRFEAVSYTHLTLPTMLMV